MARLFLRLKGPAWETEDGFDVAVDWLLRENGDADAFEGSCSLAELGRAAPWGDNPPEVIAFAPVERLLCLTRTVPSRTTSQIAKALPFAVEEFVTQDIETLHLAHGPIRRGSPVACVLVDRELLTGWLAAVGSMGLALSYLGADAGLLSDEADVAVLFDGDDALVRTADHMTRIEPALLPAALATPRSPEDETGGEEAPRLAVDGGTAAQVEAVRRDFAGDIVQRPLEGSVLHFLATSFEGAEHGTINILQGPFAPPRRRNGRVARWRGVAALGALWLLVFVGVRFGEGLWAERQANGLRADAAALYKELYPDARAPRDAYMDMRRRVGGREAPTADFERLLGTLALAIDGVLDGAELQSLSFSDDRGELTTELVLREYADLDRLRSDLEGRGLVVHIGSAEERDGVVRARLRMGMA